MAIDINAYIANAIPGVQSGGLFFGKILMYAGLFAIFCFFVYKIMFEYPVRVTLVRQVGTGALKWLNDSAKVIVDKQDNTRKLVLMRTRQGRQRLNTEVPSARFRGIKGKRDHYMFLIDDNMELQPTDLISKNELKDEPKIQLFAQDKRWWARKEDKRRLDKYTQKENWEKWLPSVVLLTAFVLTFFVAYFGFTSLGTGMNQLASSFNQIASSCLTVLPS